MHGGLFAKFQFAERFSEILVTRLIKLIIFLLHCWFYFRTVILSHKFIFTMTFFPAFHWWANPYSSNIRPWNHTRYPFLVSAPSCPSLSSLISSSGCSCWCSSSGTFLLHTVFREDNSMAFWSFPVGGSNCCTFLWRSAVCLRVHTCLFFSWIFSKLRLLGSVARSLLLD